MDRHFDKQPYLNVVVSDLTYVRVGHRWHEVHNVYKNTNNRINDKKVSE